MSGDADPSGGPSVPDPPPPAGSATETPSTRARQRGREEWEERPATLVMIAGGVGLLVGRFLLANGPGRLRHPRGSRLGDPWWTHDSDLGLSLALGLILVGLAAWHFWRFGLGKLILIGLLAVGALMTSVGDPGSGPPVWRREGYYSGDELVGIVLFIASAVVVLVGVVWSLVTEAPVGSKSLWSFLFGAGPGGTNAPPLQGGIVVEEGGLTPPEDWWLAADGKWYPPERRAGYVPPPPGPDQPRTPWWSDPWVVAAVVGIVLVLGVTGLVVFGDTSNEIAVPVAEFGDGADDDRGPVGPEEWRIELGDEGAGVHTVVMIKTFGPLEEDDVQDLGGHLVWPETEVELCRIGIRAVGDGFLQIGDIFQTTEGCEAGSGMQQAFDDFGLPDTACVFVRSIDVKDERCAPLAVD